MVQIANFLTSIHFPFFFFFDNRTDAVMYRTQKLYFSGLCATRCGHGIKRLLVTREYKLLGETFGKAFFFLFGGQLLYSKGPTSLSSRILLLLARMDVMDGSHVLRMVVWKYRKRPGP